MVTTPPPMSLADLVVHVQDIHTMLTSLGYALGRQPTLDAERLRTDLLEICLPHADSPDTDLVASALATLIGEAIAAGRQRIGD